MSAHGGYVAAPFEASDWPAIESGANWLVALATGSLALGVCVLAVAGVGLLMLSGRLPVGHGFRVVLGCFVLLGAPVVSAGLLSLVDGQAYSEATAPEPPIAARPALPPANYDPYAGASLRQE